MKKKHYILRLANEDQWIQFKGSPNTLTTDTRNIAVFNEYSLESRLAHAERVSKLLNKQIVSEDW